MLHRYVLHNNAVIEASSQVLSPGQVGLLSGWGVFTTLRVADGVLFAWERHWARIQRDARLFHVPLPEDPEQVRVSLLALVEANRAPNCTLRLAIVRNSGVDRSVHRQGLRRPRAYRGLKGVGRRSQTRLPDAGAPRPLHVRRH